MPDKDPPRPDLEWLRMGTSTSMASVQNMKDAADYIEAIEKALAGMRMLYNGALDEILNQMNIATDYAQALEKARKEIERLKNPPVSAQQFDPSDCPGPCADSCSWTPEKGCDWHPIAPDSQSIINNATESSK